MKSMKLVLSVAAASMLFIAADGGVAKADGYGPAGCGLGAMLIGSKPGIVQIFAATTNGIFANQTFGITSGTLGCGATPAVAVSSAKSYVETNRQIFAKDVARGQGETIANLSQLAGCADTSAVAAKLQANFKTVFPTATVSDTEVSTSTINLLKSDASLQCTKLI
jgi:Protein of unknown function (DUF3015)